MRNFKKLFVLALALVMIAAACVLTVACNDKDDDNVVSFVKAGKEKEILK